MLANCICASSVQLFNFLAIFCLQWAEDSDVTGLELMGGARRNAVKDNIVLKIILRDFDRLVRREAVTNNDLWFLIRITLGLGIEHKFKPLLADLGVVISGSGVRVVPPRSWVRGPVASTG